MTANNEALSMHDAQIKLQGVPGDYYATAVVADPTVPGGQRLLPAMTVQSR